MMTRTIQIAVSILLAASSLAQDTSAPVADILASLKNPSGIAVHVGCGDGKTTIELARDGRLLVHALESDEARLNDARRNIAAAGLYGQASVERRYPGSLPYAENLVNIFLAEKLDVAESEILRVLTPGGCAWIQQDGKWKTIRKSWPAELDEWTHWRHSASGNMVSHDKEVNVPEGPRWIAGPPQDSGGKKWYYDHTLVSAAGRNFYLFDTALVARDGFNGRLLWSVPIKATTFKEVSVSGARTTKVKPIASADLLYTVAGKEVVALDTATGKQVKVICDVNDPREILLQDGVLIVADKDRTRAFDTNGAWKWKHHYGARRAVAGDGKLFYLFQDEVICCDLKTGDEKWRAQDPKIALAATLAYSSGIVAVEKSTWKDDGVGSGILVFSGENGKALWSKDYIPGMTHYKESKVFFADNLLWIEQEKQKAAGLNPKTGEVVKTWGSRGLHCAIPVATDRFLIAPELEFTDFQSGKQENSRMVKSACRIAFIPANGLLNTFPVQCECFPMLRGYMGLSAAYAIGKESSPQFESTNLARKLSKTIREDDWPNYRHDIWRTGSTPTQLKAGISKQLWEVSIADTAQGLMGAEWKDDPFVKGVITAPVVAGGIAVVAVPQTHRVVAIDAETGKQRWSFTAGGRIDTPPTLFENNCIFGSHDGYVYCVDSGSGELAWRFRAAPHNRRIAAYGQLESPWPVAGSILVDKGVAYFAAGRHPAADGGVRVYAVDAQSGKELWQKTVTDTGVKSWYGGKLPDNTKIKVGVDYEPVDMLVRDGDSVAMSRWQFNPSNGEFKLSVGSVQYEMPGGVKVPRGIWGYGIRQTKMVKDRPPTILEAGKLNYGNPGETAIMFAGGMLVTATEGGDIKIGDRVISLGSPAVHDGLAAARGLIYVSTHDGKLRCLGE